MSFKLSRITGVILVLLLGASGLFLLKDQSQPAARQSDRYLVTDSAGRQVEIPRRPQRVVVLNASNLELFYAAGGTAVGRPSTEALPAEVKAAVQSVPAVGAAPNPNIEQIIALNPDLVLGVNMPFHHQLLPLLDKAGIPVLLQSVGNYQNILDTLRFYGDLSGQPDKAAERIAAIESRYEQLISAGKNRPAPKVVMVWGSPESFHMATDSSFNGDLVKRLGAVNVAGQYNLSNAQLGYVPLNMEFIAKENPDMIFLIALSPDPKVSAKLKQDLTGHPAWSGLKAVQGNQVHMLPQHLFVVNPGTQVGEAMSILAGFLYPEVAEK